MDELQDHITIRFHCGRGCFGIDGTQQATDKAVVLGQAALDGLFGFRDEPTGNFGLDLPGDVDLIETPRSRQHLGSVMGSQSQQHAAGHLDRLGECLQHGVIHVSKRMTVPRAKVSKIMLIHAEDIQEEVVAPEFLIFRTPPNPDLNRL